MGNDRLHGFSVMEDARDSVILGNTLEVFAEKTRAGFIVGSLTDGKRESMVFTQHANILRIRMLMDLMRELAGFPLIEEVAREPDPDCAICQGRGYWEDGDGNQVDCATCTN